MALSCASKSGGVMKLRTPVLGSIVKRPASAFSGAVEEEIE